MQIASSEIGAKNTQQKDRGHMKSLTQNPRSLAAPMNRDSITAVQLLSCVPMNRRRSIHVTFAPHDDALPTAGANRAVRVDIRTGIAC